jgi:hypothetical protein
MSFNRIDLLPQYDFERKKRVQARWTDSEDGSALHSYILEKIRKGAGEDFLQWDFEHGKLEFLEDYCDLAGFQIFKEDIEFPKGIISKILIFLTRNFGIVVSLEHVSPRLILRSRNCTT